MKKKLLIIIPLVLVVIVAISYLLFKPIKLELIGDKLVSLEVGNEYIEDGVKAHIGKKDVSEKVIINGNVDNTKIGNYEIKYTINYLFRSYSVTRSVSVSDSESPIITLKGDNKVRVNIGSNYEELGYEANDNYDGNITDKVEVSSNVDTSKSGEYLITYSVKDSSGNESSVSRIVEVKEVKKSSNNFYTDIVEGPTYIKGILIVNKKYKLPSTFGGSNDEANAALETLQAAARAAGYSAKLVSGYRSYDSQSIIYNRYIARWGQEYTDTVSARPGHSEHQTGLAFDVGELSSNYGNTAEGKWLVKNCYKYGFILRYLKGKENITGYAYEPWHIRYVGIEAATYIMQNNLTLEEYLGIA